jgi:DNA-binding MarR family transcriptional regulator
MTAYDEAAATAALFDFSPGASEGDPANTLPLVRALASQIVALVDCGTPCVQHCPPAGATRASTRLQAARRKMKERRARHKFFNSSLFGEPVWDILLDLYVRGASHQPTSVTSACIASGVPATTALRYIRLLEREGLVLRRADTADARRNFLELSPHGLALLDSYLDEVAG